MYIGIAEHATFWNMHVPINMKRETIINLLCADHFVKRKIVMSNAWDFIIIFYKTFVICFYIDCTCTYVTDIVQMYFSNIV